MKKLISLVWALVCVLSLCSCILNSERNRFSIIDSSTPPISEPDDLTACETNKYKDYRATTMQAKGLALVDEYLIYETNTIELITDYEKYSSYHFNSDYTEEFFENNNLLVFIVTSCSSDQMKYVELREKDGLLYPLFERKKIDINEPVANDFIIHSYCVEISKEFEYKAGEIIYNYK